MKQRFAEHVLWESRPPNLTGDNCLMRKVYSACASGKQLRVGLELFYLICRGNEACSLLLRLRVVHGDCTRTKSNKHSRGCIHNVACRVQTCSAPRCIPRTMAVSYPARPPTLSLASLHSPRTSCGHPIGASLPVIIDGCDSEFMRSGDRGRGADTCMASRKGCCALGLLPRPTDTSLSPTCLQCRACMGNEDDHDRHCPAATRPMCTECRH